MDIEVDTRQFKKWESLVESEPSSPEPGPSRLPGGFETPAVLPQEPPAPPPPQSPVPEEGVSEEKSDDSNDESDEEDSSGDTATSDGSQAKVEGLLQTNYLHSLAKEGGLAYLNHLLTMAVPPNDSEVPDTSRVREWSFKDILHMPFVQKKLWMDACKQELDSLHAQHVYDLVDPPKGRRIIRN